MISDRNRKAAHISERDGWARPGGGGGAVEKRPAVCVYDEMGADVERQQYQISRVGYAARRRRRRSAEGDEKLYSAQG